MDDSDTERESQSRAKGKNDARDALSTLSPLTRVAAPEIILILVGVIAIALITRCYYRVEIDSAFLTGLVTFDGLLIASVAFIGQYAYKASEIEGFENEAKRLGNEKQGDPWAEFFSKLFLARTKNSYSLLCRYLSSCHSSCRRSCLFPLCCFLDPRGCCLPHGHSGLLSYGFSR